MSGTTQAIRDALASLPTDCRKPWRQIDSLPYLHAVDSHTVEPLRSPVVGRFDYLETMPFVASCNPEVIAELLAELDAAQAGIEAATLAERERCAVLCDLIGSLSTVTYGARLALQWGAKRIREEVKS